MAFFDPHEQRVCVRVVYDGAAGAGKTTNMHQLASLFASRDPNRVETSYEVEGRTLYFDWLQIRAGLVAGIPLLCQIVSVPGQIALTPRRRYLLETADVVVYVCDSRPEQLDRAREGLAILREVLSERGTDIPIVLQPNHQDGRDAVEGAEVAKALGLSDVTRVDAIASEGLGVVDTFVAAVRDLSRRLRDRAAASGLDLEIRRASSRTTLLERVSALEVDPEAAAEMLLEEASASLLLGELEEDDAPRAPTVECPADARETVRGPRGRGALLPTPDVPAGFVWPAHTGRDLLGRIAGNGRLRQRAVELRDGSYEVKAEGYVLRTHARARFQSADEARQALVRAARERAQLEHLTLPDTVLVASEGGDDAYFVWTLAPEVEPLRESLRRMPDADVTHRWLEAYGVALADMLRVRARHGLELSTDLGDLGFRGERLRYLGEIARTSSTGPPLSSVLAKALAEVARAGWDDSIVRAAFNREAGRWLSTEDVGRLLPEEPLDAPGATETSAAAGRPRTTAEQVEDH